MVEYAVVLSLISPDGSHNGIDDVSLLICCVDGRWCRDFVHCLRFISDDTQAHGVVVLVWRCPRFKKVVHK